MRVLAAIAILAGCAHTPDLPLRPDPAPPVGSTTDVITARDGTQLFAIHWAPAGEPRGVVVVMHGLKDYAEHYAAFAARLTSAGYGVYAFDLRGHGRSAGPRVAPEDWQDSLRLGGDHAYWPGARAGVGPVVSGGYACIDATTSVCGWVALVGLQLYGAD